LYYYYYYSHQSQNKDVFCSVVKRAISLIIFTPLFLLIHNLSALIRFALCVVLYYHHKRSVVEENGRYEEEERCFFVDEKAETPDEG